MKGVTVEMNFKVWDDDLGTRIDITEDGDGLDLIQLTYHDPHDNKPHFFPIIDTKMAREVAEAMIRVVDYIEARAKVEGRS